MPMATLAAVCGGPARARCSCTQSTHIGDAKPTWRGAARGRDASRLTHIHVHGSTWVGQHHMAAPPVWSLSLWPRAGSLTMEAGLTTCLHCPHLLARSALAAHGDRLQEPKVAPVGAARAACLPARSAAYGVLKTCQNKSGHVCFLLKTARAVCIQCASEAYSSRSVHSHP